MQDNGSYRAAVDLSRGCENIPTADFEDAPGGEGSTHAIDPTDPNIVHSSGFYGTVSRATTSWSSQLTGAECGRWTPRQSTRRGFGGIEPTRTFECAGSLTLRIDRPADRQVAALEPSACRARVNACARPAPCLSEEVQRVGASCAGGLAAAPGTCPCSMAMRLAPWANDLFILLRSIFLFFEQAES
jgi:hypothetical protein